MGKWLYRLCQWTWGLPQTLAGWVVLLTAARGCPREDFGGAVCVRWRRNDGLSLGMFLFVPSRDPWFLTHEYGHTLQSLLLGPLYLPLVGLPSVLWASLPPLRRLWETGERAYDSVYPENWATALGRWARETVL